MGLVKYGASLAGKQSPYYQHTVFLARSKSNAL